MGKQFINYFISFILTLVTLSSCITPLKRYENNDNYIKVEPRETAVISDQPRLRNNSLTIGMESLKPQVGLQSNFLFGNQSRLELEANYNLRSSSSERIFGGSDNVNYTEKRITESLGGALNYSYPLKVIKKTKEGGLILTDGKMPKMGTTTVPSSGVGSARTVPIPMEDTLYYIEHEFKTLSTIDAKIGVDHVYSQFASEFYKEYLESTYPDGSFKFPDTFDDVIINSGTYYLKLGGSYNRYVNSSAKSQYKEKKLFGNLGSELQINAFLNVGLYSSIASTDIEYTEFENEEFVDRSDYVNPMEFLDYLPVGGELSFNFASYSFNDISLNYNITLGVAPGYFDKFSNNIFLGVKFGIGLGKFLEKN